MRILHICLCGPVTDNWNYQENLITKYHKKLGHDVTIITSRWIYNQNGSLTLSNNLFYTNDDGVKMIRLQIKGRELFNKKFKRYRGVYNAISCCNPDVLFVHGCQFVDLKIIVEYIKKHPDVKVYVDNHADFSNSATNWLSRNILHKIIWRYYANLIEPYTEKFYGVLPSRVDFLTNIYSIPEQKVELLLMGADDEKVAEAQQYWIKESIRKKFRISKNDFLIITGGKIDSAKKQTILLMKAVREINQERIKLIVFGSVSNDLKDEINSLTDGRIVQYIGWISADDSYRYFSAADLVVFPGRHSVFWEQVAGMGIPMVVKYWEGTNHVDLGGNVQFLYKDSVDEIRDKISWICSNEKVYNNMKSIAVNGGISFFSYQNIAKKSIDWR